MNETPLQLIRSKLIEELVEASKRDQWINPVEFRVATNEIEQKLLKLEKFLHDRQMHPDYIYRVTDGQRKAWDGEPDLTQEGWEQVSWERFEYHEEIVWKKKKEETN